MIHLFFSPVRSGHSLFQRPSSQKNYLSSGPFAICFTLLFLSLPLTGQTADEIHPWKSSDGRIIQAKYIRMDGDALVIEKDGKPFTIPFTKLAPASVELAKQLNENTTSEGVATAQAAHPAEAATITEKLQRIIIPKIEFSNTPMREAINFLSEQSIELDTLENDPRRKGVKFGFSKSIAPDQIDALRITSLRVINVPINAALKYVCDQTKFRYFIEGSQVMLISQMVDESEIHRRTFIVPQDFIVRLAANSGGGAESGPRKPIAQLLGAWGIAFPEGASATLSGNQLEVSNTRKALENIEQILARFATEASSAPTLRFRWLQTDPKTADAIIETLKTNHLSADDFSAKIDPQIKNRKITEVAAFDRKIISGERFVLKPTNDKLPLVMEAEATVGDGGRYMDLRCVPEWIPKTSMGSGLLRCNTATTLSRNHWYLFARWGDSKTDTLLLACGGGSNPTKPAMEQDKLVFSHAPIVVHLDAEWRETNAADLAKVQEAPPENRAKALAWLRERSTLLASATSTSRSGQKSSNEHLWGGKSNAELSEEMDKHPNKDPKEQPPRPGVTFEWEPVINASDKPFPTFSRSAPIAENVAKVNESIRSQELSLRLSATYMPLKARSKSQGMQFVFPGNKLQAGVPVLVAATADSQQHQPMLVVLVITPWYDIIQ